MSSLLLPQFQDPAWQYVDPSQDSLRSLIPPLSAASIGAAFSLQETARWLREVASTEHSLTGNKDNNNIAFNEGYLQASQIRDLSHLVAFVLVGMESCSAF